MTKHRDVNKCRGQEKYKITALIRQANKRVRNGQYTRDKKKERTHGEKDGEKRKQQQLFLKRNSGQVMSASNGTKGRYT